MTDGNINRSTHDVFQACIRDYSVCDTRIFPINIIAVKKKKLYVGVVVSASISTHHPYISLPQNRQKAHPA